MNIKKRSVYFFLGSLLFLGCVYMTNVSFDSSRENLSYYKKGEFFYPWEEHDPSLKDVVKWNFTRKKGAWPLSVPLQKKSVLPSSREENLKVYYIGHATVLIQYQNLNILTDPVFSERASPVSWAGPKRVQAPGLDISSLPPVDIVLITHDHYDHLDMPSLLAIEKKDHPLFLVPMGVDKILHDEEIKNVESLLWWDFYEQEDIKIHFTPSRHWSKRSLWTRNKNLWGSYVIESSQERIFFIGDSGFGPHLDEIAQKFAPFTLSFLPIGAYAPEWFMAKQHMSPEEAVLTHQKIQSKQSIAIHYDTFPLADEPYGEGKERLQKALLHYQIPQDQFLPLAAGDFWKRSLE